MARMCLLHLCLWSFAELLAATCSVRCLKGWRWGWAGRQHPRQVRPVLLLLPLERQHLLLLLLLLLLPQERQQARTGSCAAAGSSAADQSPMQALLLLRLRPGRKLQMLLADAGTLATCLHQQATSAAAGGVKGLRGPMQALPQQQLRSLVRWPQRAA
jgi:hypothetical protein